MKRLIAALCALLTSSAHAQVVTDLGNTPILPDLVIEQTLTAGNIVSTTGITVQNSNAIVLDGSTSGSAGFYATPTGGLVNIITSGQSFVFEDGANVVDLVIQSSGSTGVNYLFLTNGPTGDWPGIYAKGSDTNIGVYIGGKGTGGLSLSNGGGSGVYAGLYLGGGGGGTGLIELNGNTSGAFQILGTAIGHAYLSSAGTPSITSGCNGSGSGIVGTDTLFQITGQTTAATTCTVTFGVTYGSLLWCFPVGNNTPVTSWTNGTSSMTINFASISNFKANVLCWGD